MKLSKLYAGLFGCAVAALAVTGCSGQVTLGNPDDDVLIPPSNGTLSVNYTIAGANDDLVCSDYGIDQLQLTIYPAGSSRPYTTVGAPCEAFTVTVRLPEGLYDAEAVLLDYNGAPASDTLPIDNLYVRSGSDLTSEVDFPDGSIR
jgi:hypothetical protein